MKLTDKALQKRALQPIWVLTTAFTLLASGMNTAVHADDDDGFSAESIAGTWLYSSRGSFGAGGPFPAGTPISGTGRFIFNEDGTCGAETLTNFGGNTSAGAGPDLISCNFTVNADGTGQFVGVTSSPFSPNVLDFVIASDNEIFAILEGVLVNRFKLKRQDDDDFSSEDIAGSWAVLGEGELAAGTSFVEGTPIVFDGVLTFNENGSCESSLIHNAGGVVFFTVSSDCSVALNPSGDGTGVVTIMTDNTLNPIVIDFGIVNENEIFSITEGPLVSTTVFRRQAGGDDD